MLKSTTHKLQTLLLGWLQAILYGINEQLTIIV